MSLVEYAEDELRRAGLFDEDSDYGGMLGTAVLDLIKLFSEQGHSGFSAAMTTELFSKLSRWQPLGPLTSDPDEWLMHDVNVWQSRRNPSAFSDDQGRTYYLVGEARQWARRLPRRFHYKHHRTEKKP